MVKLDQVVGFHKGTMISGMYESSIYLKSGHTLQVSLSSQEYFVFATKLKTLNESRN